MKSKIDYLKDHYGHMDDKTLHNLYKIYNEYDLWDKKVRILDNTFCSGIEDMDNMIGKVFDFYLNMRWDDFPGNLDLFDIPYISCGSYNFYLKDVEFTKG